MKLFLTGILLTFGHLALAQQDFHTILPEGKIPLDFTQRSTFKYDIDRASISEDDQRFDRENKDKFYLESNFGIDDFLSSGRVLFNDPVTNYLNSVLYEVLKDDPQTRKEVRVYAVKSHVPNAFATNNGMIFVNLGLLAKLENEAQLAYILSHELIHYREQHVLNSYVKNERISDGRDGYKGFSEDEKLIAQSSYSKELEIEADAKGFDIYKGTAYSKDSMDRIFDILGQADQLLLDSEFDYAFFEYGDYRLPEKLKLTEFAQYEVNEAYDDEKSTHPNTETRRVNLQEQLAGVANKDGATFIYARERFDEVKRLARYELCRQYLLDRAYHKALYLAYDLLQQDPESVYLRKCIAKALYGATYSGWKESTREVLVSAEMQKIDHLLDAMSGRELKVLALSQLYPLYRANREDAEVHLMLKDLITRLQKDHTDIVDKLFASSGGEEMQYYQHAFTGLEGREELMTLFEENEPDTGTELYQKRKMRSEGTKVNSTLVLTPAYIKVNQRKKDMIRYADGEGVLVQMDDKIRKVSDKLKMDNDVLNVHDIDRDDITDFRSHAILNEWLNEKLGSGESTMVSPIHNEMMAVLDTYDQDYLTMVMAISVKEKVKDKGIKIAFTVLMPIFAPVTLPSLVSPKYTYHLSITFHGATESVAGGDLRAMKFKDTNSLMSSNLYYTLFKLKHGK
ncbi:M48 family metallopeptidase [Roseivirga sp. BDSF3-8]|uniref:M48 family metallopeptidase n=1 Tax=Roseivirga sp. BDSF3-8 TaxID=3241598 RepID=UPI003531E0F7